MDPYQYVLVVHVQNAVRGFSDMNFEDFLPVGFVMPQRTNDKQFIVLNFETRIRGFDEQASMGMSFLPEDLVDTNKFIGFLRILIAGAKGSEASYIIGRGKKIEFNIWEREFEEWVNATNR